MHTNTNADTKRAIHFVLGLLAGGAILSLAVLAPNAIGPIVSLFEGERIPRRKARAVIQYLKRHNLVIEREMGREMVVAITERGRKRLQRYDFEALAITAPKRWDGKWRLVAFDIPEKKKVAREALRRKLQDLGFLPIQKSLWIHPYECRNEINLVAEVFQVSPYLWLFEAGKIDHRPYLMRKFDLD